MSQLSQSKKANESKNPCYKCRERTWDCHCKCEKYKQYVKRCREIADERAKESAMAGYIVNNKERSTRHELIKYKRGRKSSYRAKDRRFRS